jgi:hypothetical protein
MSAKRTVGRIVTAVVVIAAIAVVGAGLDALVSPSRTCGCNDTASQSTLWTALTGASTFYVENGAFSGLSAGFGTIDTGLSAVTSAGSSTTHTVSIASGSHWVVITDYAPGPQQCWVIADLRKHEPDPVLGETTPGTYFGVIHHSPGGSACAAARSLPVVMQTGQFPQGRQ